MDIYKNPVFIRPMEELSIWAADFIAHQFNAMDKKNFILGTATGSSPEQVYLNLIRLQKTGKFPVSDDNLMLVQLDEYRSVPPKYYTEILTNVGQPLGLSGSEMKIPIAIGSDEKILTEAIRLDEWLDNNLIDVQILGLGGNGHLAFIEPARSEQSESWLKDYLQLGTHLVDLSEETRAANARFFGGNINDVPKQAVTRGPRSILGSNWNIVLVNSYKKAMAAFTALIGPVCREVPASMLQTHCQTIWLIAEEAGHIFSDVAFKNIPTICRDKLIPVEEYEDWHNSM